MGNEKLGSYWGVGEKVEKSWAKSLTGMDQEILGRILNNLKYIQIPKQLYRFI